ncbi:MAG: hypothetical protein H0W13_00405 [Nitrospirales bacterium]|nr:hypothetical protein [Nitrospirales bacterium]
MNASAAAPGEDRLIPVTVRHTVRNVGESTSQWLYGYKYCWQDDISRALMTGACRLRIRSRQEPIIFQFFYEQLRSHEEIVLLLFGQPKLGVDPRGAVRQARCIMIDPC